MFITILALIILIMLASYIIKVIKGIKTNEKNENDINFWMFTYDFKDKKKESIFDRESLEILKKQRKKNNLIVLLYINSVAIFIYANQFLAQILALILD